MQLNIVFKKKGRQRSGSECDTACSLANLLVTGHATDSPPILCAVCVCVCVLSPPGAQLPPIHSAVSQACEELLSQ